MPKTDQYENVTPDGFRLLAARLRECADKLTEAAEEMELVKLPAIHIGIVNAREKTDVLEKFADSVKSQSRKKVNSIREDGVRYERKRPARRKKNNG